AGNHEAEAARMGIAVDRGDQRLAEARHGLRHVDEGTRDREAAGIGRARALVVSAEAEHTAAAGEDTGADVGRLPGAFKRRDNLLRHRLADAVAVIGPPHSDDLDAPALLDLDCRCGQATAPKSATPWSCGFRGLRAPCAHP